SAGGHIAVEGVFPQLRDIQLRPIPLAWFAEGVEVTTGRDLAVIIREGGGAATISSTKKIDDQSLSRLKSKLYF
ncbi:hypothetical protein, partial [Marinibactrum halimedae]|uniref:hypothetical protein n=1 Tax=Marinibactrum halimedae TaxID=1444977 RepID=UPI001E476507